MISFAAGAVLLESEKWIRLSRCSTANGEGRVLLPIIVVGNDFVCYRLCEDPRCVCVISSIQMDLQSAASRSGTSYIGIPAMSEGKVVQN